jgi:hypothetical protein
VRVKSMLLYVYKCRWPLSNNNWQFNVNIFLSLHTVFICTSFR